MFLLFFNDLKINDLELYLCYTNLHFTFIILHFTLNLPFPIIPKSPLRYAPPIPQ